MTKEAMIVFEENKKGNVDISMKNVLSDDPTFAQQVALEIFNMIKQNIDMVNFYKLR